MKSMNFGETWKLDPVQLLLTLNSYLINRSFNHLNLNWKIIRYQVWKRMILIFYLPRCFSNFCRGVLSAAWTFMEEEGVIYRGATSLTRRLITRLGSKTWLVGIELGTFWFWLQCLGPLGNSPHMKDHVLKLKWNILNIWAII